MSIIPLNEVITLYNEIRKSKRPEIIVHVLFDRNPPRILIMHETETTIPI